MSADYRPPKARFNGINHLAFITHDLDATIRFYRDLLGFPLVAGVGHGEFRHYFFRITPTDMIAFFAYPEAQPMDAKPAGVRTSRPLGFDHVSIGVSSQAGLFELKDRLEAAGLHVTGPIDHGFIWSIYFDDPNNIPLEVSWQSMEIVHPPALADGAPVATALEGAEPQAGHWPTPQRYTPETEWRAKVGNGHEMGEAIQARRRAMAAGE